MAQRIYPDSDISVGATWSSPIWSNVDDTSDADFATSSIFDNSDPSELGMANPASTPGSGLASFNIRAKVDTGSSADITMEVYEGVTLRASSSTGTLSTSFQDYTINDIAGITNYNNLSVKLIANEGGLGPRVVSVSSAYMDVPDAASTSHLLACLGCGG